MKNEIKNRKDKWLIRESYKLARRWYNRYLDDLINLVINGKKDSCVIYVNYKTA